MPFRPLSSPDVPRWRSIAAIVAPVVVGLAAIALVLNASPSESATASGGARASAGTTAGATVRVVASTSVYGDIAQQIGGDTVTVTSIIDDPNRDPHDYQADGQNQLALSKAAVVIENGGGYDDFIDSMLASTNSDPVVLNAAAVSGYDLNPPDDSFNEHLWYDFSTVAKLASRLGDELAAIDPPNAASYRSNTAAFESRIDGLIATEGRLRAAYSGDSVMITEPVPLYLTDAIGLTDLTPVKFSDAIENGTDVAPDVLSQTLSLLSTGRVSVLVYNAQTTSAQTDQVVSEAHASSVPVVAVTETLPAGLDYIGWMTGTLLSLENALAG